MSYLGSARGYLSQRQELGRQQAALERMIEQRNEIRARLASFTNPAVIEARARELGLVKPGEVPLRVTGLDLRPRSDPPPSRGGGFWDWLPDIL